MIHKTETDLLFQRFPVIFAPFLEWKYSPLQKALGDLFLPITP